MRKLAFFAVVLLAAGTPLPSQAQVHLPDQFGDWTKQHCGEEPAAAGLTREAGDTPGAISCQYASGGESVVVWAEEVSDPTGAFEVCTDGLRPVLMASPVCTY